MDKLLNLSHETRAPGGYWELTFDFPSSLTKYFQWRRDYLMYRVTLHDGSKMIWEGRLEILQFQELGRTRATARGYWSNLRDSYSTGVTAGVADYTKTYDGDGIDGHISEMLTSGWASGARQIANVTTFLEDPGVIIDMDYPDDFSLWDALTDPIRGLLRYADSNGNPVDFFVWEDQTIHLVVRDNTDIEWRTNLTGDEVRGVLRFPARVNWDNVVNAASVIYNGTTLTDFSTDADSIAKYIRRERVYPDIVENDQVTAEALRDASITLHGGFQQEVDALIINKVWDANGVEMPLCRVRAGEYIQVRDFIPKSSSLGTAANDALRTFFVEQTTCDHETGTLTIRPDRSGASLTELLARNGIR